MRYVDTDGTPVTVYQPNERQGGIIWGVKQAISDLSVSRYVIVRLFIRDFISQFRQKILGYFWAFLTPLFGIISFLYLYFVGVLNPGEGDIPYTIYILLGSNIWGCFPGAMGAVSSGLQNQADLIIRTRIPKIALAISSLSNICYSILINMITMFIIFCLYGMIPSWWFFLYPILILPMILLGTAIGMVLSILGTIAKDLTMFFKHGLSLLMYVTPVVYLRETIENPIIQKLIKFNPLTYLIDVPRSLLVTGKSEDIQLFLIFSAVMIIFTIIAIRIFYLLEDLVAERL